MTSTGPGADWRYANSGSVSGMSMATPGCSVATAGAASTTGVGSGADRPRRRRKGRVTAVMGAILSGRSFGHRYEQLVLAGNVTGSQRSATT